MAEEGVSWTVSGETFSDYDGSQDAPDFDEHLKIFRYCRSFDGSKKVPPYGLDFITGIEIRLQPKTTMVLGEIRRIEYYASAEQSGFNITYSDLIVSEDFAYTRDSNGFALSRVHTIAWYKEDGTPHEETKIRTKIYPSDESYREGVRRRANIFDALTMEVAGMLLATETTGTSLEKIALGRQLMKDMKTSIDLFIDASDNSILGLIAADTRSWLNNVVAANGTTIRQVIMARVNIWA